MDREKGRRDSSSGAARGERTQGQHKDRFQRPDMTGGVAVQLAQGRDDGWEVGPLLGALCRNIGIGREDVGNIKLRDSSATVELSPRGAALLEARKDRLERDGLTVSSVKPATGGERRGSFR